MNVQELINKLQAIEDKSLPVYGVVAYSSDWSWEEMKNVQVRDDNGMYPKRVVIED